MAQSNGRWWEFYLVRYLLGTFTGAIIFLVILFKNDFFFNNIIKLFSNTIILQFNKSIKIELLNIGNLSVFEGTSLLIIIISFGFVYCYIASAPILVMHALRFKLNEINKQWEFHLAFFDLSSYLILFIYLYVIFKMDITLITIISISLSTISYLLLKTRNESYNDEIIRKYKILAKERAKGESNSLFDKWISEYVESYRHLREHGNTFLILIFQIILGFILVYVQSFIELVLIIFFWILPAAFIWQFGNFLESKLYID